MSDVTGHSLGMIAESADGSRYLNSIIIRKNLSIPCVESRPYQFVTAADAPNEIEVFTTQGEDDDPFGCTFLHKHRIRGLRHLGDGARIVDVSYSYDENGVVRVSASDRDTGAALIVVDEPIPDDMEWLRHPPRRRSSRSVMAYLAIDLSGSMLGKPLEKAREAACAFLRQSDLTKCSIGLIGFADRMHLALEACQNAKQIEAAIQSLKFDYKIGGGNQGSPFGFVLPLLRCHPGPRFLVLLTDGVWDRPAIALQEAEQCRQADIQTIAIGFGTANEGFLKSVATTESGGFFTTLVALTDTFGSIAREITETAGGQLAGSKQGLRFVAAR